MHRFKKEIDTFCRSVGYIPKNSALAVLKRAALDADEIIDVGVRIGTPFLYKAFPDCYFLLVDPQKGGKGLVQHKPDRFKFINVGLGSKKGKMVLNESRAKSSLLERTDLTRSKISESHEVDIITLDDLIKSELKSKKIGIKIDVEGFEHEVINGLNSEIDRVSFIVAEVSVKKRFENSYDFGEFIGLMKTKGFGFYNIMNPARPVAPRFYDVLFLRENDERFSQ